ncbi:MAG: prepilin-type N-terminal cleavage/methylation domain-containing protein [Opitutaceae bacterium]
MVSTKRIKGPRPHAASRGGFTLLEVMLVTFISSFVFAGVLSAYIFLGRGLARQVNEEGLESRTRQALFYFSQDVSQASAASAQNPGAGVTGTLLTLTVPSGSVTYACNWAGGTGSGILTRQVNAGTAVTLLTNLSNFSFGYYDLAGNSITVPATAPTNPQVDIKRIYMAYTSTAGVASTGAQSNFTVVSPTVIMKNKPVLTDPTTP